MLEFALSQKQKRDDRMEASCYHAIKNKLLFTEDGVKMKVIDVADNAIADQTITGSMGEFRESDPPVSIRK